MNRKLFAPTLLLAASGLTACADPMAPATAIDASAARGGSSTTAAPGGSVSSSVVVAGEFQIVDGTTEQIVGYRSAPVPAAAGGECGTDDATGEPDGTWTKITRGTTAIHLQHDHCTIRVQVPYVITVSFSEPATYVANPAGNINLNLAPRCVDEVCTERSIQYKANRDATVGSGVVVGSGSDGSTWTIDLAQVVHGGNVRPGVPDGIASRTYLWLTAERLGGGASSSEASLRW